MTLPKPVDSLYGGSFGKDHTEKQAKTVETLDDNRVSILLYLIIMAVASVPVPGLNILLLEYRYR